MDDEFVPNTPVITPQTKRSPHDPNEILLDNSEISDDDSAGEISPENHYVDVEPKENADA